MEIAHYKRLRDDQRARSVYCGRPSVLGNPFKLEREEDREELLEKYRQYLGDQIENGNQEIIDSISELREDSVLVCWCYPKRCHCEVIIEFWERMRSNKDNG